VPRAVDEVHFKLSDIKITGAVTLPASQFRPLYESLLGKDITLGDILNVADKIEAEYRAAGYLLVRAFVPPQRVRDGVFTINVVEGFLANISVQGGDADTRALIREYLAPARESRPLKYAEMERGLLLANDLPGVSATGILRPSPDTQGASDLVVDMTQPWIAGGIAVDNRGSRFSGLWTVAGDVEFNSIFGADQLAASVTLSPNSLEQVAGQLTYRRAIGSEGLVGSLTATVTHGQPGSTLAAFNVFNGQLGRGASLQLSADPQPRPKPCCFRLASPCRTRASAFSLPASVTISGACWISAAAISAPASSAACGRRPFDIAQGLPILGATPNHSPLLSRTGG